MSEREKWEGKMREMSGTEGSGFRSRVNESPPPFCFIFISFYFVIAFSVSVIILF